jgi:cobyrinic acid a,c-diamide synthase
VSWTLGPRLVVAGTASGVGKTTVATGLMAALSARGLQVGAAKVGPDFIDPGYHGLATGRPSRNLDPWMSGAEVVPAVAARAADGADLLVVEGVMGLFDGADDGTPSSTATVAGLLDAPILLVVDAGATSQSIAAVVHGFHTLDPAVQVSGVVLNQVGSDAHEDGLRRALAPLGIPVLGALRRDDRLRWRDRHLGLVPVAEEPDEVRGALGLLAATVAERCDLDAVERLARSAPPLPVPPLAEPTPVGSVRVAVAAGRAFTFSYPDDLDALATAGAELVPFDPMVDEALPERCAALVAGGGFPEVHAERLAGNEALLADVRFRHARGLVIWAECGGLLWLAEQLDGHPMAGVVPTVGRMGAGLTLGYRSGQTTVDSPLGPAGTSLRGHEFHHSATEPAGTALQLTGRNGPVVTGFADEQVLASYLHLPLVGRPDLAEAFVRRAAQAGAV